MAGSSVGFSRLTRHYIPVRSLSRSERTPATPAPAAPEIGLRWGNKADFSHVIDNGVNRDAGPNIEIKHPKKDPPKYSRIMRAGVTLTTQIAKIQGASADEWIKVRRFERMQWEYSEPIRKARLDESQRYRRVSVDLRFSLQPPEEAEEGGEETTEGDDA